MTREEAITKLREHAPELQAGGIAHLALFGSTARNEADDASDVDLMAEYDPEKPLSLLDVAGLHLRLEELLGRKVDLCTRKLIKPILKPYIERDAIDAF